MNPLAKAQTALLPHYTPPQTPAPTHTPTQILQHAQAGNGHCKESYTHLLLAGVGADWAVEAAAAAGAPSAAVAVDDDTVALASSPFWR